MQSSSSESSPAKPVINQIRTQSPLEKYEESQQQQIPSAQNET